MVVAITGNLVMASEIFELRARLIEAQSEIAREPSVSCTVDLRAVDKLGVNAITMVSCFMQWCKDHHPCGARELLL